MSVTPESLSSEIVDPVVNPVSPENFQGNSQEDSPSFLSRVMNQFHFPKLRFPRMEGLRPEEVFSSISMTGSGEKTSPPAVLRRAAPSNGKKPSFGGALISQKEETMTRPNVSPHTVASNDSSKVTTEDSGPLVLPSSEGEEDFELERLRFDALQLVRYQRVLGKPTYLFEQLVQAFVLPGQSGYSNAVVSDLALRLSVGDKKPIEAVVYANGSAGYEAVFATQLTLALIREYDNASEVGLHALMQSSDEEYQLAAKWTGPNNPLAGKRVVLAVATLTKDNLHQVTRQVFYLRGIASSIRVACVAKIGRLPKEGRAGLQIEAFTNYG